MLQFELVDASRQSSFTRHEAKVLRTYIKLPSNCPSPIRVILGQSLGVGHGKHASAASFHM